MNLHDSVIRKYAEAAARKWAEALGRQADFEKERNAPRFNQAAAKYSRALWEWANRYAPESLHGLLKARPKDFCWPDTPENRHNTAVAVIHQVIQRAFFLAGLHYHKAHSAEWLASFVPELVIAKQFNDVAVFAEILKAKEKRRTKKVRSWGLLQFYLIRLWLSGGLWALQNDWDRATRFEQLIRVTPKDCGLVPPPEKTTAYAIESARRRLKL